LTDQHFITLHLSVIACHPRS